MNEVETKDVGTTDLSAYMMKVIEELRRDRSRRQYIFILVRSALSSVFRQWRGGVLHADAGSLHTRSPERVRTVDVAP